MTLNNTQEAIQQQMYKEKNEKRMGKMQTMEHQHQKKNSKDQVNQYHNIQILIA